MNRSKKNDLCEEIADIFWEHGWGSLTTRKNEYADVVVGKDGYMIALFITATGRYKLTLKRKIVENLNVFADRFGIARMIAVKFKNQYRLVTVPDLEELEDNYAVTYKDGQALEDIFTFDVEVE